MLSRSNSKCPIVGFDVRFPTGELNMNPELHLPLLVIIFIERATWCESSSSYSSLTYMPFPAKKRIKGAHPGLTLFVAKLQTTYKINGTTEYSFLPGWWEVSCQWTRRRIRDKKTIIYGFHNWQLCSLTFFFFFCSIWKTVKRRKYFYEVKSSEERENYLCLLSDYRSIS